jgi:hypothetical protein
MDAATRHNRDGAVLLAIAIALPFAIRDTLETHRVCVFSRQFLEE